LLIVNQKIMEENDQITNSGKLSRARHPDEFDTSFAKKIGIEAIKKQDVVLQEESCRVNNNKEHK